MSDEVDDSDAMSISEGEYCTDSDLTTSLRKSSQASNEHVDSKSNAPELADFVKSNAKTMSKPLEVPITDGAAPAQSGLKLRYMETMPCAPMATSDTATSMNTFPLSNPVVPTYLTNAATLDSMSHLYTSSSNVSIGRSLSDTWHSPAERFHMMPMAATHLTRPMVEPLINGHWVMNGQRFEESSIPLVCEACSLSFRNRLSFDIHMAGLRHLQRNQLAGGERAHSQSGESSVKKMKVTHMLERNVGLLQHFNNFNDDSALRGPLFDSTLQSVPTSRVENQIKAGDCNLMKNRLSNVVERNVSLFKQLSHRLADNTSNILSDQPPEHNIVQESLDENIAMHKDCIEETRQVSPVGVAYEDGIETVKTRIPVDSGVEVEDQSSKHDEIEETKELNACDSHVNAALQSPVSDPPIAVLGADYVTEYVFINGEVERTCDLCETNVASSVLEHARTTEHIIRFIFHQEPEAYRLMSASGRLTDTGCVHQVAQAIELKQGSHIQPRVFLETDKSPSDSTDNIIQWTQQEDERVRKVSDLPGHRNNLQYSTRRYTDSVVSLTPVSDLPTLLDRLALQSCLAQGKPPSLQTPINLLNVFSSVSKFDVKNDSDAEVSLQLANILTLSVLTYRMEMLPGLKPADRTKYESRLSRLLSDAQLVAAKANSRELSAEPSSQKDLTSTHAPKT